MRNPTILLAFAAASSLAAQTFPLPFPAGSPNAAVPGSTNAFEATAPFLAPERIAQTLVTDRVTLTSRGLPASFGLWDMSAFDPSSRFIFVPSEAGSACGVFRYDTQTGAVVTLLRGNGTGVRSADPATWDPANDDFARFDPCTFTPWGTIAVGEETTGGRMFEVLNPLSPNGPFQVRWLSRIPAMAHEGTRFDHEGNLYVVDENNSGSIYKYVPATPGDLSVGQTFVLRVDAYAADPNARAAENWNSAHNLLTNRFGPATWVPLTDAAGNPLTSADPFTYGSATGGRDAADEVAGTPYGRPEDSDFNVLADGNQCLYVSVTSENAVISVECTGPTTAIVRAFVGRNTVDLATGAAIGSVFASPDNLAADAFGNLYIVEDGEPDGGDIYKAIDANRDGVAESMGVLLSLGISGSEPTGMIFDPNDPFRFIVSIQHPASGNDALWSFRTRPYPGSNQDLELQTGVDALPTTGPGEFVKTAQALDTVVMAVDSPAGSLYGAPFALLLQPFSTAAGAQPFLPPLWLNPFLPILPLVGGPVGPLTTVLPFGGSSVAVQVPPFLGGLSVMVQGLAVAASGALLVTDGHEVVLR